MKRLMFVVAFLAAFAPVLGSASPVELKMWCCRWDADRNCVKICNTKPLKAPSCTPCLYGCNNDGVCNDPPPGS